MRNIAGHEVLSKHDVEKKWWRREPMHTLILRRVLEKVQEIMQGISEHGTFLLHFELTGDDLLRMKGCYREFGA